MSHPDLASEQAYLDGAYAHLDRMRESFFGGSRGTTLSAEIVVSPHEAFWGVLVPLRVPLRRTCARCGGRGEVCDEWCVACCGAGEVPAAHDMRLRVPAGVREGFAA